MSFLQATIRRSIPAVASLALLLVFALYMVVAVPILEGESATAIPNIDPLGLFKSQSPGQWISLFPEDAWQRDQGTRNIIKADENIVIFQDYQQQADGKLQVSKLCLLLFDKESQTNEGEVDLDGKHFPTVIEAIDGAELSFDNSRPTAMGKYGELQQVRFLGEVQFWKESRDPQKSMFLQTQELLVTGQKATTKNPVRFRFGDTLGQAVGLDLVFDNPDLQKTLRPALTKIEGISLARFGNIQHLEIKVPVNPQDDHSKVDQNPTATGNSNAKPAAPTSREIQLQCSGPAEFLFDQLYANFHSEVQVKDLESGYQLNSHLLQILFTAAKVDKKPSLNSKDSKFLPKGLTAHRIIAQGNALDGTPTIVRQLNEPTSLSAAQLTYDLTSEKFQADSVIPGATDSRFPAFVQLISEGIEVQVPQLNYHLPQDEASRGALGQVWAQGAGKLIQDNEKNQLTVSWQNQMTLLDDRDMEDRKVVSFYGDVQTRDREGLELDAQKVHFWLVENQQPKTDSSSKDRFSPDLMLAQDHVRFQSTEMSGLFDEARIYFPPAQDSTTSPTNQIALPGSDNRVGLQQGRAPSNVNDSTATQTTLSPIVARLGRSLIQLSRPKWDTQVEANSKTPTGPYITAGKLMVTLMHSADADAVAAPSLGKGIPSGKYRPQQIHLQEHVEIIEAHWDEGKVTPETKPQYHIQGQNITGIQQGDSANGKPLFQWEIAGSETHEARVETPTMQLQSQRLFFDQRNNRAWTKQPGSVVFPMQMKSLESGFSGKPEPADDQDTNPGVGSLLWHSEMSFDGRTFSAVGNIRCDIQQNTPKGSKQIQARAYQLELMLDQAVSFDGERITQYQPKILRPHQQTKLPCQAPTIESGCNRAGHRQTLTTRQQLRRPCHRSLLVWAGP